MAVIESSAHSVSGAQPLFNVKVPFAAAIAAACAGLSFVTMARHGFNDAGIRLASEMAWRFASFMFFAAVIAGPLCRLIPYHGLKRLNGFRRQMIWAFAGSYAVFLGVLLLPNMAGGASQTDAMFGMTMFAVFGGGAAAVMAFAASREAAQRLGDKSRRALLSVAAAFFWLTYSLTGLAHLAGPHRPDSFYGLSLSLMILALLLRFADRFWAKLRGTSEPGLQT